YRSLGAERAADPAGQRPPAPPAGARPASGEKAAPRPQPGQAKPAKPEAVKPPAAKPRPGAAPAPAARLPQRPEAPAEPPPPQEIEIPATITVRDLAEMMQRSPIEVIKVLMNYGIMAPITQSIDFDTAAIIGEEMGVKIKRKQEEVPVAAPPAEQPGKPVKTLRQRLLEMTPEERLKVRPPVVTVLGHVDHGKTTLLDAIRKTDVASGEAGGITQHIGAYQVEYQGRKITFLDTPGHEAFTAMRARGAQATDIAVLVVAADDGVMPQTKEAIAHARAAGVPIVVALNKIDKPNANPERVKQELADQGLLVEEWGGDVICVPVSAKYGKGIDELLENLLLLAEVEGFKADAEGEAIGTVIESKLDKTRGPSATLLVQKGTLRTGDALVIGGVYGRVRAMFDDRGNPVEAAGPSTPVVVIGLSDVPSAGEVFRVVEDERKARELAAEHASKTRESAEAALQRRTISLEDVFAQMQAGKTKELRLIVKVDVDGSMEPVLNSINHLSTEDLRIKILHAATGDVTESDLMLAAASDAIVIGFNVQVSPAAQKSDLAQQVDVRLYNVIYELVEDVDKALKGLLEPVYQEKVLGRAEVRAVFRIPKRGQVAGCFVQEGEIQRNAMARVRRNGTVVGESRIGSLKRFTEDVTEVKAGFECGVGLDNFSDFQVGDVIEVYQKVRV
ncbi:MAG: translation initiation factor IF-2, partial [Anaerolineae bacterium]|nr:translation initiation factor IF-2 [Anaerolineae bacterium]